MNTFNISDYVDIYIDRQCSSASSTFDVDFWEDQRETMIKNTRNLINEFKNPQTNFSMENTSIFQYFPLESLSQEEQYTFIDHLMRLKDAEGGIGNKMIHNLKKISNDLSDDRFNNLLVTPFNYAPLSYSEQQVIRANRNVIRQDFYKIRDLFDSHTNRAFSVEDAKEPHLIHSLLNIYSDSINQSVNYWVVGSPDLGIDMKRIILCSLKLHLEQQLDTIKSAPRNTTNAKSDLLLPIFISILKLRNRCGEHWKIATTLREEEANEEQYFQEVPSTYHADKSTTVTDQNLKEFLNEGKMRCDNFEERLAQTKGLIRLLSNNNLRNASPDSLLDLKVFYREMFISKSKYKINALNIARKYLPNSDEHIYNSEMTFLNEKISRGFFREKAPIEFYNLKNEIQHLVYLVFIELLLTYDINTIVETSCVITMNMQQIAFSGINSLLPQFGREPIF